MDSFLSSTLQKWFPWIAIFTILSVIPSILGYGVLSFIAISSLVLILSTIVLTFINQKPANLQEPDKDVILNTFSTQQQSRDEEEKTKEEEKTEEVEEEATSTQHLSLSEFVQESQPLEENLERNTKSEENGVNQVQIGPPKLHSCSSLSEDSDMDFGQSREYSDDSISDEESLFEITLPNGQFVCPKQDSSNSNYFIQQDYSSKTVFYQPKLIELFAEINEINEEENLIEIDLSMGSIKCSRFEIEA